MPLADMVGGIAGAIEFGCDSDGIFTKSKRVAPQPMFRRILPGQDAGPRRRAHWLHREGVAKEDAALRHTVQIRRQVHGVESHGSDAIPAKLVGIHQNDVRARGLCGAPRLRCRGDSGQGGQQCSSSGFHAASVAGLYRNPSSGGHQKRRILCNSYVYTHL